MSVPRNPDYQQNPSTVLRHVALLHSSAAAHVTSGGGDSRGSSEDASEAGAAGSQGGHETHSANSSGAAAAGDSAGTSSSSSSGSGEEGEGVKAAVLQAALTHVPTLGWSSAALIAGARDNGLSPSVLGMLPRGEAHLVEFFMDRCRKQFEAEFPHTPIAVATAAPGTTPHTHSSSHSSGGQACGARYEEGDSLALQSRMAAAIRTRLRVQAPYTSSWAQALAIQARPSNACESLRQRRQLAASMWSAVGVRCSDTQLLAYRVLLGSAYAAAEVHMLTDFSPDFHDTWRFVDREMQAAFQIQGSADRLVKVFLETYSQHHDPPHSPSLSSHCLPSANPSLCQPFPLPTLPSANPPFPASPHALQAQACDSIPAIKTALSILSKPPSTRQA
ncbi:unnamed protein product [Closterium sp. Naga37s-1]|nr:unnamed protein product [Closterium sp. Naga37s-1]